MTIGILGLGAMGAAMARRLIVIGEPVMVWNRSPAPAALLAAQGARVLATPAALIDACDILVVSLLNQQVIDAVLFGPYGLPSCTAARGRLIVDTSTCDPDWTREIARRVDREAGARWVDGPVSGGVPGAEAGELTCFAGGPDEDVARMTAALRPLMARITHMGEIGTGQTTKIFNQMIVASAVLTIAETVSLAARAGITGDSLVAALEGGFADSRPLRVFAPRMAARQFQPVQTGINLYSKDLALAEKLARQLGGTMPVSRHHRAILECVVAAGLSPDCDVAELIRFFDVAAGKEGGHV
jgi:3-hydroxyisobutyrate dehydrogenase